ncbi:MAG: hypothetical protein ACPGNV_05195 [Mangrovicoccus sp.]
MSDLPTKPPEPPDSGKLDLSLVKLAAMQGDAEKALHMLKGLIEVQFDAEHGADRVRLRKAIAAKERGYTRLTRRIERLERDLETEPFLLATKPEESTGFLNWSLRDKVETGLLGLATLSAMGGAVLTAQATMTASGLPIFFEQPWLSWTMAGMAPLAAVTLKVVVMAFPNGLRAKLMAGLYAATTGFLALWVLLFAQQFQGMSGGFDPFADLGADKGSTLTAVQLLAEMLAGATLAVRLTEIAKRYAPDGLDANPRRHELELLLEKEAAALDPIQDTIKDAEAALSELDAACEAETQTAALVLGAYMARMKSLPF